MNEGKVLQQVKLSTIKLPSSKEIEDMDLDLYEEHRHLFLYFADPDHYHKPGLYIHADDVARVIQGYNMQFSEDNGPLGLIASLAYKLVRPSVSTALRKLGEYFTGLAHG